MKITIDTDILRNYNLSLGQYLVLLVSYYNLDCQKIHDELVEKKLAERDLFKGFPPVLSDNSKNLIAKIIIESDEKLEDCDIDFENLAMRLQEIYPDGIKPGKTYSWRDSVEVIAQKLRTLAVRYDFQFSEEQAINATREYVDSFKPPYTYMNTLRNFLLHVKKDEGGYSIESNFMTIVENNHNEEAEAEENTF